MSVLTDLMSEIESYPRDFLDLEVVDVDPAVGAVINRDEEVAFRLRVTNRGHLDVRDLSLVVTGLHGTLVKTNGAAAQFGPSFTLSAGYVGDPLGRGASVTSPGSPFVFKPTSSSTAERTLLRVEVGAWNTDLDHILLGHSNSTSGAQSVYSAVVSPQ